MLFIIKIFHLGSIYLTELSETVKFGTNLLQTLGEIRVLQLGTYRK